jgi:hypothetical protein
VIGGSADERDTTTFGLPNEVFLTPESTAFNGSGAVNCDRESGDQL